MISPIRLNQLILRLQIQIDKLQAEQESLSLELEKTKKQVREQSRMLKALITPVTVSSSDINYGAWIMGMRYENRD